MTDVAELKRKLATSRRVIRHWQNAHNELCKERAELHELCRSLTQEVNTWRRRVLLSALIGGVVSMSTWWILQRVFA